VGEREADETYENRNRFLTTSDEIENAFQSKHGEDDQRKKEKGMSWVCQFCKTLLLLPGTAAPEEEEEEEEEEGKAKQRADGATRWVAGVVNFE
jgi:hypothetical protein